MVRDKARYEAHKARSDLGRGARRAVGAFVLTGALVLTVTGAAVVPGTAALVGAAVRPQITLSALYDRIYDYGEKYANWGSAGTHLGVGHRTAAPCPSASGRVRGAAT